MFFFGIFGTGSKSKVIREFSNIICTCGCLSRMELFEEYMYFHFFFIPIFKWGKKYYLKSRCCGSVFLVPDDYADEILKSGNIDLSRLRKIKPDFLTCPDCHRSFESDFEYCPYCGRKM